MAFITVILVEKGDDMHAINLKFFKNDEILPFWINPYLLSRDK